MIIPYGKQRIDSKDIRTINKVLKSDFLTQGPMVKEFEKQLKRKLYAKYATVVNNGSSALLAIGKILNWKRIEPRQNIIHIHGKNDTVFPVKNIIYPYIEIPGDHAIILTKHELFNKNLPHLIQGN